MNNSITDLYSLCWSNHTKNLKNAFEVFRCDDELVDVTLSCEGKKMKAHKIVISACSRYFLDLIRDNPCQHPIIILRDVKYQVMSDILHFMYQGEVNVTTENLQPFLKTAELLQVKGLVDDTSKGSLLTNNSNDYETVDNLEKRTTHINKDEPLEIVATELDEDNDAMELVLPEKIKNESVEMEHIAEYLNMNLSNKTEHETILTIRNSKDDLCQKNLTKDSIFPCRFCDKIFSHPNSLRLHLPKHSGSTSCELCHAVLSRKYELKVHMRKKHNLNVR